MVKEVGEGGKGMKKGNSMGFERNTVKVKVVRKRDWDLKNSGMVEKGRGYESGNEKGRARFGKFK